jgi:phage tail-like protein
MGDLIASADLHGRAIDLSLAWSAPRRQGRDLRVVRRRFGYPSDAGDGLMVLDLADLLRAGAEPWARIDRARFLILNDRAEGGILQAELAEYYEVADPLEPSQVIVRVYDSATDKLETTVLSRVSYVTRAEETSSDYGTFTTISIFTLSEDGIKALAGRAVIWTLEPSDIPATTVTLYTQKVGDPETPVVLSTQGESPYLFQWTATGGATISALFSRQEKQRTAATLSADAPLHVSFVTSMVTTAGAQEVDVSIRTVEFTEAVSPSSGDVDRTIAIADREPSRRDARELDSGLDPGTTYYYAAFVAQTAALSAGPRWTASAVPTERHGFADKLYSLLPAVHRYYDDPASGPQPGSGQPGSWQLRRFLQVLGPVLDQVRSLGEALPALHDLFEVRADYLPYLAQWIGWQLNRTLPTPLQRNDILLAPEVFATTGTVPNIEALVQRATGWDCKAKEFVHNVFLTNAADPIRLWEIWKAEGEGGAFNATSPAMPGAVTRAVNDSIDARPTIVADPSGGAPWLFWHSNRAVPGQATRRRRIWTMRATGTDMPRPAMPESGASSDEWPAAIADVIHFDQVIRLFWSSSQGGQSSLWTVTLTDGAPGEPVKLTHHPAGDFCPAAVRDINGLIWLFWQSSRRGPTDIWAMTFDPIYSTWSAPKRVTTGRPRDGMPAAVLDSNHQVHLFWSADLGEKSRIFHSIFDAEHHSWGEPEDVSSFGDSSLFRDEAPAAALSGDRLWLFWCSDRDGMPRIWASKQTDSGWGAPFPVTAGRSAEKDPAPLVTAEALHLFFSTQRGGEPYRSRTVNMADLGAIKRGKLEDRWHYTYSVELDQKSCYSRDAVGLYITPDDVTHSTYSLTEAERVRDLVEPFRPLPVRFLWFVEPPSVTENVYSPEADIGESYTDVYPTVEVLGEIGESSSVTLQEGWSVLHTNTPTDVSADLADLATLRRRTFFPDPE